MYIILRETTPTQDSTIMIRGMISVICMINKLELKFRILCSIDKICPENNGILEFEELEEHPGNTVGSEFFTMTGDLT